MSLFMIIGIAIIKRHITNTKLAIFETNSKIFFRGEEYFGTYLNIKNPIIIGKINIKNNLKTTSSMPRSISTFIILPIKNKFIGSIINEINIAVNIHVMPILKSPPSLVTFFNIPGDAGVSEITMIAIHITR